MSINQVIFLLFIIVLFFILKKADKKSKLNTFFTVLFILVGKFYNFQKAYLNHINVSFK